MNPEGLPFPQMVRDIIQKEIPKFNPVQNAAIPHVLKGENIVVASPTASGKTLVAEIAILRNYIEGGKSVYLVPLKALASEKYREFKEKYPFMKTALSIGDLDSQEQWLGSYDLIIASNEKMDSLLRHKSPWISNVTLLVIDEIHMLNDQSRGPTLEIVITRMKDVKQVLALSATIQNANEIAQWLKAKLVKSDYRPVKLEKGVAWPEADSVKVEMEEREFALPFHEHALAHDVVGRKKQCIYFVSTRKSAEASAEKMNLSKFLEKKDLDELSKISKEVENVLPVPTKQCRRLAKCVKQGSAFHHAGLLAKQRHLIEQSFLDGKIKVLSSTPTLAYGMNLPAYRVVIRDTRRFDSDYGSFFIPVMDVHQMMGRAGRPKFDKDGEAILLAKTRQEAETLRERYINSDPEPIYSKLGMESMLRMHVLALIASETVQDTQQLREFFSRTFFAKQYGSIDEVMDKIQAILSQLESWKFIRMGGEQLYEGFKTAFDISSNSLEATKVGRRVSELYVDPQSAFTIIQNMKQKLEIEMLLTLCSCMEMKPLLGARKADQPELEDAIEKSGAKAPDVWSYDYEEFMDRFKTSLMFSSWADEKSEEYLLENFGITPGELYNKLLSAEWLLFAASELSILLNQKESANEFNKLRLRIKHGVRTDLLKLVMLKGIGRVRARKLCNAGIRSFADIVSQKDQSEKILGKKVLQTVLSSGEEEDKVRSVKRRR